MPILYITKQCQHRWPGARRCTYLDAELFAQHVPETCKCQFFKARKTSRKPRDPKQIQDLKTSGWHKKASHKKPQKTAGNQQGDPKP